MENRKLFRMRHEPCSGRCYTPVEVLELKALGDNVETLSRLLADLVRIHEPACGREQLGFALDHCAHANVFVAVFSHFGAVSTYVHASPVLCLRQLIDGVKAWYESDDGKRLLAEHPGDGKDACEHGHDPDLVRFALTYSGLSESAQREVSARTHELLAA